MKQKFLRNPFAWVPSLYFAEGLPYVAVMTISLILYKQMGLSNSEITFYTSWLYLPWLIKPRSVKCYLAIAQPHLLIER